MRNYAGLYSDLLTDLTEAVGQDPLVSDDLGVRHAAARSLAQSFYKKLCPDGNSKKADANALEKFKQINDSIPERFVFEAENEAESCFWDYFKYHLNSVVGTYEIEGSFSLESIREGMSTGPGAAQKADSRCFVTKLFGGEMSYSNPSLIPLYRAALVETGLWADAERCRFERYGFTKVAGGTLFFATKNAEISRTCCTPSLLHQLVQMACGAFLEKRLLKYYGISLSTQPDFNRKLACLGSIDGSFATIDLVSASDSIGMDMLDQALDRSFLKTMIWASRDDTLVCPDGSLVLPRMIATMGNGYTFPLQTVIFASAVRAACQLMELPTACPKTQFGVFGDDIIVPSRVYEFLCRMLNKLGFQVNVGKSFNVGPFRESCGHDYYAGRNIRGVYIRSLEIPQQVYSALNRLTRWSARHDICILRTLTTLRNWCKISLVPPSEADDSGVHVPFKATTPRVDSKYWFKYRCQRRRVKTIKLTVREDDGSTVERLVSKDGDVLTDSAIGVGFLSGHIRRRDIALTEPIDSVWNLDWSASVSLRDRIGARARYNVVTKSIPYWDWHPDTMMDVSPEGKTYVRHALTGVCRERWEALTTTLFGDHR